MKMTLTLSELWGRIDSFIFLQWEVDPYGQPFSFIYYISYRVLLLHRRSTTVSWKSKLLFTVLEVKLNHLGIDLFPIMLGGAKMKTEINRSHTNAKATHW